MGGLRFEFCTVVDVDVDVDVDVTGWRWRWIATLPGLRWLGGIDGFGGFNQSTICRIPPVHSQNIGIVSLQAGQLNSRRETSSTCLHLIFAPVIGQKNLRYRATTILKLKG
jgi:hypothetical protein